ncbi:unnamed protein product [Scytosiphon promiscuus]
MPKAKPAALAAAMKDLPPDWEARDVKGRIVFINHSTRTTQWEKPKLSSKKPAKTKVPHASVLAANAAAASAATKARGGGAAPGKGARPALVMILAALAPRHSVQAGGEVDGAIPYRGTITDLSMLIKRQTGVQRNRAPRWESKIINKKLVYIDHANQKTTFERPTSRTVRGMEVSRGSGRAARGYASAESEQARSQSLRNQTRADVAAYQLSGDDFAEETLGITSGGHARGPANPIYASNASAKQYTSGDSPLPPGWGRSVTANGELYYVNHVKKTTTWTRPQWTGSDDDDEESYDEDTGQPESVRSTRSRRDVQGHAVESAGPPLPPGWEERMSAEGKVFYINHNDKTTHWTRPDPPAVQPDAYPAEDAPSSEITASPQEADLPSASASSTTTPAAEKDLSPEPAGGGDGVAAATSSPSSANGSGAAAGVTASAGGLANGEGVERSAAAAAVAVEEEEEEDEEGEGSAVVVAAPKEEESEPASDKAGKVAVEMEEVAGACSADAVGDPKRAPSATVAGDATAPSARIAERSSSSSPDTSSTTVAERSLGAPAKVGGGKEARESSAEEAEAATADDGDRGVSAGETAEGGGSGGSVASIVKSGLFGATITRPGGSSSNGSSTKSIPKKNNGGVAPVYASSTGPLKIPANVEETAAAAAAAAAANADVEADEDVEETEPEEDELPEGWMELRTAEGKVYYQNGITRTTQWNRPEPPEPPTPKAADTAKQMKTATYNSTPSPLIGGAAAEQGWEKVMTVDGRPYFQNTITKMTSWHQPEGWEEPGVALPATDAETAVPAAKGSFFKSGGTVVDVKGLGVEATTASEVAAVAPTPIGRMAAGAPVASSTRGTDLPLAEGEEAPLPPGWEKLFTEDGVPFWTNHNERTTSWDPPTPLPAAATAAAAASSAAVVGVVSEAKGIRQSAIGESEVFESVDGVAEAAAIGVPVGSIEQMPRNMGADGRPLPEGWEMQTTDQGVPYYVDHINKRTSWDPPLMSSGGMSVIASELPDIPPAELVPDSADLYMGADLLNRFFCSWRGDTQGKSPLEAARNVIVTYLTGPGLKITKGRNGTNLQRYLYLSPTNKQVVWATKATPKGTLSKKGLTLDAITELHSEAGGIRVEARGESTPLILKSAAVETLTSEGATILLGVLLADMTGTMLRLQGVNGGSGSCYYPASFVNEVLTVRRVRTEKNAALAAAAAASASHQAKPTPAPSIANKGSGGANGPAAPQASKLSIVSAAPATGSVAAAVASFSSPKHQQQRKQYQHGRSQEAPVAANGNGASHAAAAAAAAAAHAKPDPAPAVSPSPAPRVGAAALTKAPAEASTSAKPSSVASEWRAAERAVTSGSTKSKGAGVAASYMAHLSKGSQKSLRPATAAAPASSSQADDAGSSGGGGGGAQEEAPASAPGPAAAAAVAAVAREEESSFSAASSSFGAKPEIAVSGGDESSDSPVQKNNTVFAAKLEGEADEGASSSAAAAARAPAVGSTLPEEEAPAAAAAAAVDEPEEEEAVAEAAQAPDELEEDGGDEDEETREYRRVLTEMLRPAKMEKYVDSFLGSGITLDILPLVERADLHSEVGIEGAVPQLKIMKAIKTRFPHGV